MGFEIRAIATEEADELRRVTEYAFANNQTDEEARERPSPLRPEWTTVGFVDGRIACSFGAFPFRMRLNGAPVAAAGVTAVATYPEFRRQGLLRRVMDHALAEQRDRGQSIAILWASMGAIYQRYGYGLAMTFVSYEVDPRHIIFTQGRPAGGAVRLMQADDARPLSETIYNDFHRPRNLMLTRAAPLWDGMLRERPGQRNRYGVYHDGEGRPRGYVVFRLDDKWIAGEPGPNQILDVVDCAALDLDASRGIWEFFGRHDLVRRVTWHGAPDDDPIPQLFLEPRELRRRTGDGIWMRVNDVAAALPQRPYGDSGVLTLRVVDDVCPWNDGTYVLETTGQESHVSRVDADADLTLTVHALAALLSGHRSATFLARAGLVEASEPKALTTADRLFATAYAPWCPNGF